MTDESTPRPRRALDPLDDLDELGGPSSVADRMSSVGVPVEGTSSPLAEPDSPAAEPVEATVVARDGSTVAAKRSAGVLEDHRLGWRQILGALLVAFGLSMFGWIGWQYFGTNITSNQAIASEKQHLKEQWQSGQVGDPAAKPVPGDAVALMRIPKLGDDYEYPVIAGTEDAQLSKGIGWYTSTAQPGQIGNFAVAGHRITHGEPFARLLELNAGDEVVVETQSHVYTYQLTTSPRDLTVKDDEGAWVLWPVPEKDRPGQQPTQSMLTLTTCTDLVASPQRSVAFGKLVKSTEK